MSTRPVLISCDSACDPSPLMRERFGIEVTPMYVLLGEETYQDGVTIFPEDIYRAFDERGILPTTSAIPPEEYISFFQNAVDRGFDVVHVGLSSEISSTCQNAMIAAGEFERVFVIDSRVLSCSGALLAIEACRLAEKGMDAEEIANYLKTRREQTKTSFIVGSLTYLAKGGRCSSVAALGANILGIKPSIGMRDGSLYVDKKYRGKLEQCFRNFLKDQLAEADGKSDHGTAVIYHAGISETLFNDLYEQVLDSGVFSEVFTAQAGSIISSHCGRETIGFTYQTNSD